MAGLVGLCHLFTLEYSSGQRKVPARRTRTVMDCSLFGEFELENSESEGLVPYVGTP